MRRMAAMTTQIVSMRRRLSLGVCRLAPLPEDMVGLAIAGSVE